MEELGRYFPLINENYEPLYNTEDNIEEYFWLYDFQQQDYFLTKRSSWYSQKTNVFKLLIDNRHIVKIPETFYILIAEVEQSRIDWIQVDEIISREFEVFTIPATLDTNTWQILSFHIIGHEEDYHYYYPYIKNPVTPIHIGNNKAILVSNKNLYYKMKKFSFTEII